MIIACPACHTRYVVPGDAIGVEGRTVRCAKCKNSWHQDGPEITVPEGSRERAVTRPPPPPAAPPPAAPPPAPQAAVRAPIAGNDAQPGMAAADDADIVPPPAHGTIRADDERENEPLPTAAASSPRPNPTFSNDDDLSQFDYQPPFRGRRNPLKMWTAAAALFAVLALGTVAAVSYYGLPDWMPFEKPTFAVEQPDLVLDFPPEGLESRTLPNNAQFFGVSGAVTNLGRETLRLPSILIVLTDERDRPVFTWEVAPPQPAIAPGEKVTINEAMTDVPKSAKYAEIGWKPD